MASFRGVRRAERSARPRFLLYVEGPRDGDLLCAWARRCSPGLARVLRPALVILGGRQPARAVEHLRDAQSNGHAGARGLCVLDRDGSDDLDTEAWNVSGLDFFMWSRRHIESYLLVPAALQRGMRLAPHDGRVTRFFRDRLPPLDDEPAWRTLEAKRLFAPRGDLARALGRPIPPGRIARAMLSDELHPDIRMLFERVEVALGFGDPDPAAIRRPGG